MPNECNIGDRMKWFAVYNEGSFIISDIIKKNLSQWNLIESL